MRSLAFIRLLGFVIAVAAVVPNFSYAQDFNVGILAVKRQSYSQCLKAELKTCQENLRIQARRLRAQGHSQKSRVLLSAMSLTCQKQSEKKCASKKPVTAPAVVLPTATSTATATPLPVIRPVDVVQPTSTPTPVPFTPTFTATATATNTFTFTPTATATATSAGTLIATATPTNTATATATPTRTSTSIPANTVTPIPTRTSTPTATVTRTPTRTSAPTLTPTRVATATMTATSTPTSTPQSQTPGISQFTAVWANDGGDKVVQSDLRKSSGKTVTNSVWDGTNVNVFAARNEVISFNLVLEAANQTVQNVGVDFNSLTGPNGYNIGSRALTGLDDIFNYVGRNIELFFVQYLKIEGVSKLSYQTYDERHVPERMRRPFTGAGYGVGTWADRPDADKYMPDIAVPLEAKGSFNVQQGNNQSVWVDLYIPNDAPAGNYTGTVAIKEAGQVTRQVPVKLQVMGFALPETPSSKTMVYLGYSDINKRYLGETFPSVGTQGTKSDNIRDRHFQMAHRHKISLIDTNDGAEGWTADSPRTQWLPRLDGTLFSHAKGYDGPGVNVGNGIYSIGTYGTWGWKGQDEAAMRTHSDNYVNWFNNNSPATDYFLYLIDESGEYAQTEQWASWLNNNPGVGKSLKSFATAAMTDAYSQMPSLDIAASWFGVAATTPWQTAANSLINQAGKHAYMYNGVRPASGSFATEDDGIALRELAWGQYKKQIDRWFFWNSTYYNNYQAGEGDTDVFKQAKTFGGSGITDLSLGKSGWNYSNGDGVLFYPGTDKVFPTESYNLDGPIASLRLKHWRRGIQDVDYVTLANAINPTLTAQIVNSMVPKALWENGVSDPNDPSWVRCDISWSTNPDDWESARKALANIILGAQ